MAAFSWLSRDFFCYSSTPITTRPVVFWVGYGIFQRNVSCSLWANIAVDGDRLNSRNDIDGWLARLCSL